MQQRRTRSLVCLSGLLLLLTLVLSQTGPSYVVQCDAAASIGQLQLSFAHRRICLLASTRPTATTLRFHRLHPEIEPVPPGLIPHAVWDDGPMRVWSLLGISLYKNDTTPANAYWLSFSLVYALAIFASLPLLYILSLLRKWTIPHLHLCSTCAYDLRAHAPGQRCPECGSSIRSHPQSHS